MIFSADETADLGADTASTDAPDYPDVPSCSGRIHWVQLDIGEDDHDLVTPEERFRIAMTRQ